MADRGIKHPDRGGDPGSRRNDRRLHVELMGKISPVQRTGTAKGHEVAGTKVDSTFDRDLADATGHGGGDDS